MASGGDRMIAELVAFAVIGIGAAVISWLWSAGKRAITGTPLSKDQQEELKQFKKDQGEDKKE